MYQKNVLFIVASLFVSVLFVFISPVHGQDTMEMYVLPLARKVITGEGLISQKELLKISLADFNLNNDYRQEKKDSDGDGLSDDIEFALGTNPQKKNTNGNGYDDKTNILHQYNPIVRGNKKLRTDSSFAKKKRSHILREKTKYGIFAWYVNADDGKLYFFGRDEDSNLLAFVNQMSMVIKEKKSPIKKIKIGKTLVSDCGDSQHPKTLADEPGVCFYSAFKKCESMTYQEGEYLFGPLVSKHSQILGMEGDKCKVRQWYTKIEKPSAEWLKKYPSVFKNDMICKAATSENPSVFFGGDGCMGALKDEIWGVSEKTSIPSFLESKSESSTWQPISFWSFASGQYTGRKKKNETITSLEELTILWNELYPNGEKRPVLPEIDFSKEKAFFLVGDRGTNTIEVQEIQENSGNVSISLKVGKPQEECSGVDLSQPFRIIIVSKSVSGGMMSMISYDKNTIPCSSLKEDPRIYTNDTYKVSLKLPDAVQYFTASEATSTDENARAQIEFSQFSKKKNKTFVEFVVYVIQNEKWPAIEKVGGFSSVNGDTFSFRGVNKIGSNDTYTFASSGGDFDIPDDIGSYTFEPIEYVSYKK